MISDKFVFVGFFLSFLGGLNYLIDTLKGKAKPNKVTWFLWTLAPLIAFTAEVKQGVGLQSLMTFSVGFNPLLIFTASFFNKKSQWKISRFDIICGLLSSAGLIFWFITRSGNVAIIFSIFADGLAAIPTVVKSYLAPETESYQVYLFGAINAFITLLTIKVWTFAHYAFPLYIFLICVILFVLIKFEIGKIKLPPNRQILDKYR
jgi:hypothetical protein